MKAIVTIGEILVEIMATERGDGFLEPVKLIGPFPSGAPAIFVDRPRASASRPPSSAASATTTSGASISTDCAAMGST